MTAQTVAASPPPAFSAVEVCQLAGVTYRQLDYWARNGQLVPSVAEAAGSGSHRRYSSFDVAHAKVLGQLHALGIRPGLARDGLPENLAELIDHLLVELHTLAATYAEGLDLDPAPPAPPPAHR